MQVFMVKSSKRAIFIVLLAAVVFGGKIAWDAAYPSGTWRYKMTVVVDTPEGIRTGSAVREVHANVSVFTLAASDLPVHLSKGEAVVVDLGKRGVLFALLGNDTLGYDYRWNVLVRAFPIPGSFKDTAASFVRYYRALKTAKASMSLEKCGYPSFVRFADIKDPRSIQKVLSVKKAEGPQSGSCILNSDHTEELLGKGVKIKGVFVEMVDEPVTMGVVKKWLPWVGQYQHKNFAGESINAPPLGLVHNIGANDFYQGE